MMEQGDISPMMESALLLHENFMCLIAAGFTEDQAIYLIGQWVHGQVQHG